MLLTALSLGLIWGGTNCLMFLLRGFRRAPKPLLQFPSSDLFEPIPEIDEELEELHDMQVWAHLASKQPLTRDHLERCHAKPTNRP